MAKLSPSNPLGYIIKRQYKDTVIIKEKIFKERLAKAGNLYRKDLLAHYGCVNAIEFSEDGNLLISGGDDRRVLIWNVPKAIYGKGSPTVMDTSHSSNIFCLAFDSFKSKIYSGGNDDQVILHDTSSGNLIGKLPHRKPVYGLSVNPQNDYVLATAGDDGRILIFDIRESNTDTLCLAKQKTGFHSVMFNPGNPRWLATANSEEGIALWDCRKPKEVFIHYDANAGAISGISACFNSTGTRVLALRRRLPPVLYATEKESAICQFYHPQYYNSCTMKTCCFAGSEDEYILSGSDDFNLYMWKVPENYTGEWGASHLVLRGHRSIVNQVRYNKENNLIASSGVEKMVKLWGTMPVGTWSGSLQKDHGENCRTVYSHEDYIYLVGHSGERISHDYSDHSTQEDCKMMAFFDSLIQREIEGWESLSEHSPTTDSDSDGNEQNCTSLINEMFLNRKLLTDEKKHKSNRIDLLIAKKRSRLAKMAHEKSTSSLLKCNLKDKNKKKKAAQKHKASKFKKNNGINKKSNHKNKFIPERSKLRKYRTRQSLKEMCDSGTSNNSFDTPSTSTGITSSSNTMFRIIEQDSDEDMPANNCVVENNRTVEESNFVNILPTPLNGTHDMFINVLEMTNTSVNNNNNNTSNSNNNYINNNNNNVNVVAVRNEEFSGASTSNSRYTPRNYTSNSYFNSASTSDHQSVEESIANSVNSYIKSQMDSYNKDNDKRTINNENQVNVPVDTESDSDFESNYRTPLKKRRTVSFSDSGFGTGPSSSTSTYSLRSIKNRTPFSSDEESTEDELSYEQFQKRVQKARMVIRKNMGLDSDTK